MTVLHRRQMGQLDAIQKCAHGELARKKEAKRYTFTLSCATCEIESFSVTWAVEALRFLGGHVKHRTWITAEKPGGARPTQRRSAAIHAVDPDTVRLRLPRDAAQGMTKEEIANDLGIENVKDVSLALARLLGDRLAGRTKEGKWWRRV